MIVKNTIHSKRYYIHSIVYKNQVCSSCVIDKFLITKQSRNWSDDKDDEDDEYDSGIFTNWDAQNLHHINQRKGHRFTQTQSDDEDDKDDENDSKVFPDLNAQNMSRIKQRKRALLDSGVE